MNISIKKYTNGLIIHPELSAEIGNNIQGPSLIKTPKWLPNSLGKYYLYFADHKGDHIKMAYSDYLLGPWKIHKGGTLQLNQSGFLTEEPQMPSDFNPENSSVGLLEGFNPHPDQSKYIPSLAGHSIFNPDFERLFSSEYINKIKTNYLRISNLQKGGMKKYVISSSI